MRMILAGIFLLVVANSHAGQTAITDTGETVTLNSDGTWAYIDKKSKPTAELNTTKFVKPASATFLLKSSKNNSAYWLNTDLWSFKKSESLETVEYRFYLKGKDLYGMAITEEIPIPIETLTDAALTNARNAATDARITKKERRIVNGKEVIYMEMSATVKGIPFTYMGYYSSDPSGSTQLVTYTATSLAQKYRSEVDDFLNGLTVR